ncbi:hypothetical protein EYC84_006089 [Monilinia fructicola]|uniref:Anaphase-promoting complex subunit 11 RING-H2 finger domain-containing protein n=1 Tax=Monilinia fructicola TaxID=38448 RepID=A0A5M9K293_MONFR|nr:hypothetical protein EYC84_006089 [Monilinia fructicola]
MKVKIRTWNAVATWRWDLDEDDVCGICQVHFDGTCPTCKYPGDELQFVIWKMRAQFPYALHSGVDQTRLLQGTVPYVQTEVRMDRQYNGTRASSILIIQQTDGGQ